MKKMIRSCVVAVLSCVLILGMSSMSFASEQDQFEKILDDCNKKYGLDLEYVSVGENADIEMYSCFVESVAKETRETLDYIQTLENRTNLKKESENLDLNSTVIVKEKSKTVNAYSASGSNSASSFRGTAKYHITNGNKITDLVSFTAKYHNSVSEALFVKTYEVTSYTSNLYDGGSTLGVTARGKLVGYDSNYQAYELGNVTTMYMYSDTY